MSYDDLYPWLLLVVVFVLVPIVAVGLATSRDTALSRAIEAGDVILGMTESQVEASWGPPRKITESHVYVPVPATDTSTTWLGSLVWRLTHPYKTEPVPLRETTWEYANPWRQVVFRNGEVWSVTIQERG